MKRGTLRLNLGLREKLFRGIVSAARISGLTIIRTKARDEILDSAPWLAPYFLLAEKTTRPNTKATAILNGSPLRFDNPHLASIRKRYAAHPATDHIQWRGFDVEAKIDPEFFRADNLYVFQGRRYPPIVFYATAAYVKEVDHLGLLNRLCEDDHFGAETFDFHGKTVSRDLLDSVLEINFLAKYLSIFNDRTINILDIGAGYGRLAVRAVNAKSNIGRYYCIDAVPESTFIS